MTALQSFTVYLGGPEPVHAIVDAPAPGGVRDTGVLICPPFGWDEVASYRARHGWAGRLAADGYPAMRISLPGTGHSAGSPRGPGRVGLWTEAVASGVRWLREPGGCARVVVIGIGLGGLIAHRAVAAGAVVDELVLWAVPARGRTATRALRAFAAMQESEFFAGLPAPEPPPEGELAAGGFVLTGETVAQLAELDVAGSPLPDGVVRRALVLGQDSIEPDERLLEALRAGGRAVQTGAGDGFGEMVAPPQQATPPLPVFDRVADWIGETASAPGSEHAAPAAPAEPVAEMDNGDGVRIREWPLTLSGTGGAMPATVCEPADGDRRGPCVVLLNAGAIYRIGPNRMWVEAARRWAARGLTTVRIDIEGIGDADGGPSPYGADDDLYTDELTGQVLAAVDQLAGRGLGERFVLGGLCSGAYWSLHGALADPRVVGAMMLNLVALVWDPALVQADDLVTIRSGRLTWDKLRRNFSWGRAWSMLRYLLGAVRRRSAGDDVLGRLRARGIPALFVFGEDERLCAQLELSGQLARLHEDERVTVERVLVRDHTLRPTSSQRQVHAALDRFVLETVAAAAPAGAPAPSPAAA